MGFGMGDNLSTDSFARIQNSTDKMGMVMFGCVSPIIHTSTEKVKLGLRLTISICLVSLFLRQGCQNEVGCEVCLYGRLCLRNRSHLPTLVGYRMAFGDQLLPFGGKAAPAFGQNYLLNQARVPESSHTYRGQTEVTEPFYPMTSLVYLQFTFAAVTLYLLAGSVLGRMNIKAWLAFVPLWLIYSLLGE